MVIKIEVRLNLCRVSRTGKITLKMGIFEKIPEPEWESFADRQFPWERGLERKKQYGTVSGGELS